MASAPDRDIVPTLPVARRLMTVLADNADGRHKPDRSCAGGTEFARR